MTITPFLALALRGRKDAVLARQRARRVASLLHFGVHEQACIAAGTFVVACQALTLFQKPRLCFQIDHQQLQVFAQEDEAACPPMPSGRLAGVLREEQPAPYRLTKALPPREETAEELDLGWLVASIEQTAHETLFDEIVKQNQEVLALLHDLRLYQGTIQESAQKPSNPHAA